MRITNVEISGKEGECSSRFWREGLENLLEGSLSGTTCIKTRGPEESGSVIRQSSSRRDPATDHCLPRNFQYFNFLLQQRTLQNYYISVLYKFTAIVNFINPLQYIYNIGLSEKENTRCACTRDCTSFPTLHHAT